MKAIYLTLVICLLAGPAYTQNKSKAVDLTAEKGLKTINVDTKAETYRGKESLKVTDPGVNSEVKIVKVDGVNLGNGIIEVEIAAKPAEGSMEGARGFVGIAFRINEDNSRFECIYLRPTNGRANDQLRRNHSVQYISFPDFPWYKLRNETPGLYESYVDLVPGEWTKVRIEIKAEKALLYVHGNSQPTLIVNDLKLGKNARGSIGLWIGPGTEAHFAELVVTEGE